MYTYFDKEMHDQHCPLSCCKFAQYYHFVLGGLKTNFLD